MSRFNDISLLIAKEYKIPYSKVTSDYVNITCKAHKKNYSPSPEYIFKCLKKGYERKHKEENNEVTKAL